MERADCQARPQVGLQCAHVGDDPLTQPVIAPHRGLVDNVVRCPGQRRFPQQRHRDLRCVRQHRLLVDHSRNQVLPAREVMSERMLHTMTCPHLAGNVECERFCGDRIEGFVDLVAAAAGADAQPARSRQTRRLNRTPLGCRSLAEGFVDDLLLLDGVHTPTSVLAWIAAIPWSSSPRSADTRGKTGADRIRQLRARAELSVSLLPNSLRSQSSSLGATARLGLGWAVLIRAGSVVSGDGDGRRCRAPTAGWQRSPAPFA
jgi:hypothetical protein